MKRVSLGSMDHDDIISIIMAHPMAGRYVASLVEDSGDSGMLASYAVVFSGDAVCLRVPNHVESENDRTYLLVWSGEHKNPWRVESMLLPRDGVELRLLTLAVTTGRSVSPQLPNAKAA